MFDPCRRDYSSTISFKTATLRSAAFASRSKKLIRVLSESREQPKGPAEFEELFFLALSIAGAESRETVAMFLAHYRLKNAAIDRIGWFYPTLRLFSRMILVVAALITAGSTVNLVASIFCSVLGLIAAAPALTYAFSRRDLVTNELLFQESGWLAKFFIYP